jgi:eukaryotic-like serine/threonine-protein kinase
MATVYLGRISGAGGFQRFVAIKRLHPHLAREPEFIQMFLDEARLAARIHHPNVVPILEIGATDNGYYLVMEYVEGDTLGRLVTFPGREGKPVPLPIAGRIMVDMLTGLHAAHELADDEGHPLQIVHRDVSPQNVLVGVDGSSRLSDFGVARATSKLSTTQNGQLKGKLAYMAPEQARGVKDIDRRADVFAAGVVMWEALTGQRLFRGDGEADTFNKVLHEPIPLLGTALPTPPPTLEGVLSRALSRDREARYPTAAAFADDVEQAVREVGPVGTHRDVAKYLQSVLGTEIAQQRDAVRSWLARDPSRPRGLGTPSPPGVRASSAVSGVTPRGLTPDGTPSSDGLLPPSGVAPGASSGGLPLLTDTVADRGADLKGPPPTRMWLWAAILIAVIVAGAVVARRMRAPAAHPSDSHAAGGPAAPQPVPTASAPSQVPSAAPQTSAVAASPSAASVEPSPQGAPTVRAAKGARPTEMSTAPKASAPAAAERPSVPDDIVRNPYR